MTKLEFFNINLSADSASRKCEICTKKVYKWLFVSDYFICKECWLKGECEKERKF